MSYLRYSAFLWKSCLMLSLVPHIHFETWFYYNYLCTRHALNTKSFMLLDCDWQTWGMSRHSAFFAGGSKVGDCSLDRKRQKQQSSKNRHSVGDWCKQKQTCQLLNASLRNKCKQTTSILALHRDFLLFLLAAAKSSLLQWTLFHDSADFADLSAGSLHSTLVSVPAETPCYMVA